MEHRKRSSSTHYDVLGVHESADGLEIKEAFRSLVLLHHPDKKTDSDADFINQLQNSYGVLRDPTQRKEYDEQLRLGRQRKQSRYESAIVLEQSDCVLEKDDDGGDSVLVYPCRCGVFIDTSPFGDNDQKEADDEVEGLLECPGCSLAYDIRKLNQ